MPTPFQELREAVIAGESRQPSPRPTTWRPAEQEPRRREPVAIGPTLVALALVLFGAVGGAGVFIVFIFYGLTSGIIATGCAFVVAGFVVLLDARRLLWKISEGLQRRNPS